MTIITSADQFNVPDLFIDVSDPAFSLLLKCEGLNFAGSIKLKTAAQLISAGEEDGTIRPGSTLVESSSGSLGVAMSMIAASRGYRVICVTDSRCPQRALRLMTTLGAHVEIVTEPHPTRGLLGARLDRIAELVAEDSSRVWLNQYANRANWQAHWNTTGPEIVAACERLDTVFVGVGTAGTVMGVTRYLRVHRPGVRVVGIDVLGSVSLGGPALPRHIPGLGAGVVPRLLRAHELDDVVIVSEEDTVSACRGLLARGFVLGGSTGTVLAGARRWLAANVTAPDAVNVAISPDLGEGYLDTVYSDEWVRDTYGDALSLRPDAVSRSHLLAG